MLTFIGYIFAWIGPVGMVFATFASIVALYNADRVAQKYAMIMLFSAAAMKGISCWIFSQ